MPVVIAVPPPRSPSLRAALTGAVRVAVGAAACLFAPAFLAADSPLAGQSPQDALAVRITSPMGRTGLPGPVRIVAQVRSATRGAPVTARFFVDHQLLRAVDQGPPYVVEWIDENPFDRKEIAVEVTDALGNEAADRVVLEPFEVIEASQITSVLVDASVQDKNGRFVRDLTAASFKLTEDGAAQVLDVVAQEEMPATLALLIDGSTSMSRRMDFVHRTASTLAGYLRPRDRMIVAPFARGLVSTTGPTDDRKTILEAINAIRPSRGTAILDSLVETAHALEAADGRRAIVLITDGYDEHSTTTFDAALKAVKAAQATVYVVGIGGVAGISIKGERLLKQLATDTGGRCFLPEREEQLVSVHDTLTGDVQNRYLLTYTPANQHADGTWRRIAVNTIDPELHVRARAGYFAPKPAPIRGSLEFTALDASGRYLDLTADDLEVLEDGEPQKVDTFQEAVQPVSIVLALDSSGSMRKSEKDVVDSAREFVSALRPEDALALVLFADHSVFVHDLSTKREETIQGIDGYKAIGGTALYDALSDAFTRLAQIPGRRAIVVMTDGRDENNAGNGPGSVTRYEQVTELLKQGTSTVFTIGLGAKVDQPLLRQMAELSGGLALFPRDVKELAAEYQRIVEDLRRRYIVAFTSSHPQHDGQWRTVTVRLKNSPEATVRSVGGYFAPEK